MQAIVFDFTFRLRERNKEIYISRSTAVIVSQGFKMILVGSHPKNFSMRSAVGDTGTTQKIATDFFEEHGSPYNRALFFGDGIFTLSREDGYSYTPTVLLRKSLYHETIIGRLMSARGFLTVDRLILVRRSVLSLSINPTHEVRKIRHENKIVVTMVGNDPHKKSSWKSSDTLMMKANGRLLSLKKSIYPRMIGGKTTDVLFFSEKMSFSEYRFGTILFKFTPSRMNLNGIKFTKSIALSVASSRANFNGLRKKYVIISLEKKLISLKALKSRPSRLTIKG